MAEMEILFRLRGITEVKGRKEVKGGQNLAGRKWRVVHEMMGIKEEAQSFLHMPGRGMFQKL
jgi:hypothetical protein